MKPISLRFQCFGPYMAEQYIDFEALQQSGLFLICGETGAGKTTILDAMCYALYGRSSGGLRGDLSVMRCSLAKKEDETLTEFVFDSGGKRHKFTRSLKYGRKNLNDSHNCLVLQDGVFVPIFENPKATFVNQKAEALIGLTYDQFRQVIMLPQGQFEKLLVSNSEEKEKILVSLFHADRWQRIAEELSRRVTERDSALRQEKLQIAAKLGEYGCTTWEQLREKRRVQEAAAAALAEETAAAQAAWKQAQEAHQKALLLSRSFQELDKAAAHCQKLLAQVPAFQAEEALLEQSHKAEAIRPQFLAFQEAAAAKTRAETALRQEEAGVTAAAQRLDQAKSAWEAHEARRPGSEKAREDLTLLQSLGPLYRTLGDKTRAAGQAEEARSAAEARLRQTEASLARLQESWQQASLQERQAMTAYLSTQEAYHRGIGGILAKSLTAGAPCPVCGSRDHPAPAQPGDNAVTDAMLSARKKAMLSAGEAEAAARQRRDQGEQLLSQASTALHQAQQHQALCQADLQNALDRRVPGIDSEGQLEARIRRLTAALDEYALSETRIQAQLAAAQQGQAGALSRRDSARETLAAAEDRCCSLEALWREALASAGFETMEAFRQANLTPEELRRRSAELTRFQAALSQGEKSLREQQAPLDGIARPEMDAFRSALAQAEQHHTQLSRQQALAAGALEAMTRDEASLAQRQAEYACQRQQVDEDLDFANRLRGRSGVSLQRYVLGVMLTSITVEANRLLKSVYAGRYQLYRTDEISGSGRKSGLELEVFDAQTQGRRSVTTLSGGEKFLVALSLAIGLSTVVQAQGSGIRLEAMFIDEGFGSLDPEATRDALEVLQGIQRSAGLVGIISHVEQLSEIIPTRLEITKSRGGSTCRLRG